MPESSQGSITVSRCIDRINAAVGRAVAWCALALVMVQIVAVIERYVFGMGWIWVEESIVYLHAALFMAGAAYTLLKDGHVRVDIFYREAAPRQRAWVDLAGTLVFLWPVSALIVDRAWPYVWSSWVIRERSAETSGIPAVFLLKSLILVFAILLALQGLSMALKALRVIRGERISPERSDAGGGRL